jgi:hypothetical protein
MAKRKVMFYRKDVGRTDDGELITIICRMDRGHCDFVYGQVTGGIGIGADPGVYDASDYEYLVGASEKSLEHMGFQPM